MSRPIRSSMSPRCGGMTNKGTPCMRRALFENGKCMWHGGEGKSPEDLAVERLKAKGFREIARSQKYVRILIRRFGGKP